MGLPGSSVSESVHCFHFLRQGLRFLDSLVPQALEQVRLPLVCCLRVSFLPQTKQVEVWILARVPCAVR